MTQFLVLFTIKNKFIDGDGGAICCWHYMFVRRVPRIRKNEILRNRHSLLNVNEAIFGMNKWVQD